MNKQVCFLKYDFDRTVKPFWNQSCQNVSDNLFLPYSENKIHNFNTTFLSRIIRTITAVYPLSFPLVFKRTYLPKKDVEVKATKKIRFYFTSCEQESKFNQMMIVARRAYNLAVDLCNNGQYLNEEGNPIDLRSSVRQQVSKESYETGIVFDTNVCDNAVLEAVKNFVKVCQKNKEKKINAPDGYSYSRLGFKSRKNKKQTFTHPRLGKKGVCFDSLGAVKLTEKIPEEAFNKNVKVTIEHGRCFICVVKKMTLKGNQHKLSESQAHKNVGYSKEVKVIALDPGSRTFMTGFNENESIIYGKDFSVKCLFPLAKKMRELFSLRAKLQNHMLYKKDTDQRPQWMNDALRYTEKSLDRLACRRQDLVNNLHKTVAIHLVNNYDVIYLPDFETKTMVKTRGRKMGRKAVHDMLSLSHYLFKEYLLWSAEKHGKEVVIVNESYTSKTQSWDGVINEKLGSSRVMKDGKRIIDRDINGARNIYLKHVSLSLQNI